MKLKIPNFSKRETHCYPKENDGLLLAYENAVSKFPKQRQKAIRDMVAKELVLEYPIHANKVIWTGKGDVLFFDSWSKKRFYSDHDIVEGTLNRLDHYIKRSKEPVSMSEIYSGWSVPSIGRGKNEIGFTEGIDYEIKIVEEGDYVNNVILFVTRPHNII